MPIRLLACSAPRPQPVDWEYLKLFRHLRDALPPLGGKAALFAQNAADSHFRHARRAGDFFGLCGHEVRVAIYGIVNIFD